MMLSGYKEQLSRVQRLLDKIKNQDGGTEEYIDNVWAFFQNCWHLKDWIKNDAAVPAAVRASIEQEVKQYDSLKICADLANRSKHLKLTSNMRCDAKITGVGVTIHAPPLTLRLGSHGTGEAENEKGYAEHPFYIETDDGKTYYGISLAVKAVDDWNKIFAKFNLA
jgi:hypothetical protein